jgi:hypothetical protein
MRLRDTPARGAIAPISEQGFSNPIDRARQKQV